MARIDKADQPDQPRISAQAGLTVLVLRNYLLWLVVPFTLLWWLVAWPVLRHRKVRLGQLLGWADLNLVAAIEHTVLRRIVAAPFAWTPVNEMPNVTHRIGPIDLG
jgi:hypothetical protein